MAKLTWEYVRTQHQQHGERGPCAFNGCETEPCPTFRKVIKQRKVKPNGIKNHCPDDRSVPIK